MLVSDCFMGDENDKLKDIQHDMYSKHLYDFYKPAKDAFYSACHATGNLGDDYKKVLETEYIDHRRVQHSHDYVAAKYRFEHFNQQLSLFPERDGSEYMDYVKQWYPDFIKYADGDGAYHIYHWPYYLKRIGEELAEIPSFVWATINSLFLQDDPIKAMHHEHQMMAIVAQYIRAEIRPPGADGPLMRFEKEYATWLRNPDYEREQDDEFED